MEKSKVYQIISSSFDAHLRCIEKNKKEWEEKHKDSVENMIEEHLPNGSGFDSGTKFDFDNSKPEKLIFLTSFHHMDDNGMYDGWTDHKVIVTPSLQFDYNMKVTGKNKNQIKDYIYACFNN